MSGDSAGAGSTDAVGAIVVIITCEHGGNRIPPEYAHLFRRWQRVLDTHRGYDPGALAMARDLAVSFDAPLVAATVSRLLIDLNRSLSNPRVWSAVTRDLATDDKQRIVAMHYAPYRQRVAELAAAAVVAGRRVVHVSSHSFTPVLDGHVRTSDVSVLYDPARPGEAHLAASWQAALARNAPALRVRRNYPYQGKNDGLTKSLRQRYAPAEYVGLELEFNQALVQAHTRSWRPLRHAVAAALHAALRDAFGVVPRIPNPFPARSTE